MLHHNCTCSHHGFFIFNGVLIALLMITAIFSVSLLRYGFGLVLCMGRRKKLPPGPFPLPIIGNLNLLGVLPHQSLSELSKTHGSIMLLRLGFTNTVVISSASMAKEVLQKQDVLFSTRFVPNAMHALDHFKYSTIFLPVASRWRSLRRIMNSTIFSNNRLDANENLRSKKVEELVEYCRESCRAGEAVDLGLAAFKTSLNVLSNAIFSRDWEDPLSVGSGTGLKDLIRNVIVEMGKLNLADYFSFLERFDLQGIRCRTTSNAEEVLRYLKAMIDERVEQRKSQIGEVIDVNVMDALLTISKDNPQEIDGIHIDHMCLDLYFAGTDTTSSTLEWAMAEALRNPRVLAKVKDELDQVIGKGKTVSETDIENLPYLQCMVKETMRLHPAVPFLIPRVVEQEVNVCGYTVPKKSQILVNAWAIGRDANTWVDALEFKPERFLNSNVDIRGRDFELIPFGAGRRICPGLPLAMRVVTVMLGSLLNSFSWEIEDGVRPEDLNMEEKFGFSLQKAYPLRVIPVPL